MDILVVNAVKSLTLEERLKTKFDYIINLGVWVLYLFTFLMLLLLPPSGSGGPFIALRFGAVFSIFPLGFTLGLLADRFLARSIIEKARRSINEEKVKKNKFGISIEDILRIGIITLLLYFALPWIAALFGITHFLWFQPVHVGEHHGYYGFLLVIFTILETRVVKYYQDSFGREIILLGFIFFAVWGLGWIVDDFLLEQFSFDMLFTTPLLEPINYFTFSIQMLIIGVTTLLIYYIGWRRFYYKRISAMRDY